MAERHGVYVQEQATKIISPVYGTAGLQVIVGTAPVNMLEDPSAAVNTPLLVQSYAEAVEAVGYSDDFAAYTLCESISVNFQVINTAPLVFINVLDPARHSASFEEQELEVDEGAALLEVSGVLPTVLKVSNGEIEPEKDADYTTLFNTDGVLTIALIEGGVDVNTEKETGLEVIRQIYPKLP